LFISQASQFNTGLFKDQRRFLTLLVVQYPSQRLPLGPGDGARLLVLSGSRGVIANLQGGYSLLTEGLHLRITDPKALDVFQQPAVLRGDLRKTIGQLALLDWSRVKQLKEFCDGLNTQLAGGWDEGAQPSHQLGAIACLGRRRKTHQFHDLFRRHAANRRDGGVADIADDGTRATRSLRRPAADQLRRCRLRDQSQSHGEGKPRDQVVSEMLLPAHLVFAQMASNEAPMTPHGRPPHFDLGAQFELVVAPAVMVAPVTGPTMAMELQSAWALADGDFGAGKK
jgi:hypothetical protein